MKIDGKKYYHVFSFGGYPQGDFTIEEVFDMSKYYSPNFREACFWIGHQPSSHMGTDEPRALAWVESLTAINGKLYIDKFSFISERLKELVRNKEYKYVSIELLLYLLQNGTKIWYPSAFGLTNRPAVDGLEELEFDDDTEFTGQYSKPEKKEFTLTEQFDSCRVQKKISFTFNINSINQNQNAMNEFLKKIAQAMGIDVMKFVTDSGLSDAITKTFTDKSGEAATLTAKVTELEGKKSPSAAGTELTEDQKSVRAVNERLAKTLVSQAIKDKKILPADENTYVQMATDNYELVEKAFGSMGVHATLVGKQVNDSTATIDFSIDPKFKKADGNVVTYADIKKKPSLVAEMNLTDDDVKALREKSSSKTK